MLKIRKLECLGTEIKHKERVLWGMGMGIKEMRKKKIREELTGISGDNDLTMTIEYDYLSSLHLVQYKNTKKKKGWQKEREN